MTTRPSSPTPSGKAAPGSFTLRAAPYASDRGLRGAMGILLWALLLGLVVGLVASAFRLGLESVGEIRFRLTELAGSRGGWRLALPVLFSAALVTAALFLVRRFAPETSGSGVQEIEGALEDLRPLRWKRVLPVKFVAGLLSLGGGMALGREGPTIQMGGNLGKMLADLCRLSWDHVNTLVAAGAAAGLSAAFNAPLSGVLFVVEEMRLQFRYTVLSLQCVLVSSAVADIVVRELTSQDPVIDMTFLPYPHMEALWLFPLFGALFGLFGVLFNGLLVRTLGFFQRLRGASRRLVGPCVGGLMGGIGLLSYACISGGYQVIPNALEGRVLFSGLLLLFVARFATTILSYGSGVPGGIFAPMLALGTLFGMGFGHAAHAWMPQSVLHPAVFAVAGMGALFAATVRAPLTGIGLAVEMTGNYEMLLPLLLTCLTATVVAEALGGRPIYTVLLERALEREGGPTPPPETGPGTTSGLTAPRRAGTGRAARGQ